MQQDMRMPIRMSKNDIVDLFIQVICFFNLKSTPHPVPQVSFSFALTRIKAKETRKDLQHVLVPESIDRRYVLVQHYLGSQS